MSKGLKIILLVVPVTLAAAATVGVVIRRVVKKKRANRGDSGRWTMYGRLEGQSADDIWGTVTEEQAKQELEADWNRDKGAL